MTDSKQSFVTVGRDRRLSATVQGDRGPLVLLDVGLVAEATSWTAVAEGVSNFARVCFYDRAGRGASDADPVKPRGPDRLVEDVHALVREIGGGRPCVFVGQSFGGVIGQLLAHRQPGDVAGLVLVDSMHEGQFDACGPLFPPSANGEPPMITGLRAFWSGGWRNPAQNKEGIDMEACLTAARSISSLGSLPISVLTAKSFVHPPIFPREHAQALQTKWEELQTKFTTLSSSATYQVVSQCGHFMQMDNPRVVIDAIKQMVVQTKSLVHVE